MAVEYRTSSDPADEAGLAALVDGASVEAACDEYRFPDARVARENVTTLRERLVCPAPFVGLVHADLNPTNALVTPDGVKLVDFEGAGRGHLGWDAALLCYPFPMYSAHWATLPDDVSRDADRAYRAVLAQALPPGALAQYDDALATGAAAVLVLRVQRLAKLADDAQPPRRTSVGAAAHSWCSRSVCSSSSPSTHAAQRAWHAAPTMEQPAIRLDGLEGLALIIEFPSGVHYTNQAGGVFCQQPRTEGVLVPLGSECHLEEKFDTFFAKKPIHLNLGDADTLDEILHTPEEPYVETPTFFLKVDRNRLDDSMEAWLYVIITACPDKMAVPPFEPTPDERYPVFGFGRRSAVLTWPNSD